jgi:methenyltetrahydromethanopterin cyclohydrolase
MESLNRMGLELVDEAIEYAEELDIGVFEVGEATVLDFGVEFQGGMEAGLFLSDIQTAGLASIDTRMDTVGGAPIPHVEVTSDHPGIALLCSQKGGWEILLDDFEGLGSGPARALVGTEAEFREVGYHDAFDFAVLAIETEDEPTEEVVAHVAEQAEVEESSVFLCTFASASVAGSVSIAARAPELTVYHLHELGYDVSNVVSVSGSAPVAPVAGDRETAMARTNDALTYGGQVHVVVEEDSDVFPEVVSASAEEHGRPFEDIFADAEWDFSELSRGIFAPAQVTVDVVAGPTHCYGAVEEDVLVESFGL